MELKKAVLMLIYFTMVVLGAFALGQLKETRANTNTRWTKFVLVITITNLISFIVTLATSIKW